MAASTGKYPRHPCNPRSDCECWKPNGAWERPENGNAADTAAATTLTTRLAGEHGNVIAEVQYKESIMFLTERPANHWSLLQFSSGAKPTTACKIGCGVFSPCRPGTKR